MPDYVPQIQLPTGLAEQTGQIAAQRAQILPDAINRAMQTIMMAHQQQIERQRQNVDPSRALQLAGQNPQAPAYQLPQGFQGPVPSMAQSIGTKPLNPNEQSLLSEGLRTKQMMTGIKLRGEEANLKGHTTLTQEQIDGNPAYKKAGLVPGTYPDSYINEQTKPTSAKAADSTLTAEEQQALVNATLREKDPLAPSMITFRGPRAKTMAQALLKDPTYSPNAAEGGLAGAKAGASAEASLGKGGKAQQVARSAQSAGMAFDVLQQVSDAFPRSDVQALNKPIMQLESQVYPEAQNWKLAIVETRSQLAQVFSAGGVPDDKAQTEAYQALPDTITAKQLPGAIKTGKELMATRTKGWLTPVSLDGKKDSRSGKTAPKGDAPAGWSIVH